MSKSSQHRARLLISCADQPGIVAAVSDFFFKQGANIVQSTNIQPIRRTACFFMRIELDTNQQASVQELRDAFSTVAASFNGLAPRRCTNKKENHFVSKEDHCLLELLWRWRSGELDAEIPSLSATMKR